MLSHHVETKLHTGLDATLQPPHFHYLKIFNLPMSVQSDPNTKLLAHQNFQTAVDQVIDCRGFPRKAHVAADTWSDLVGTNALLRKHTLLLIFATLLSASQSCKIGDAWISDGCAW